MKQETYPTGENKLNTEQQDALCKHEQYPVSKEKEEFGETLIKGKYATVIVQNFKCKGDCTDNGKTFHKITAWVL